MAIRHIAFLAAAFLAGALLPASAQDDSRQAEAGTVAQRAAEQDTTPASPDRPEEGARPRDGRYRHLPLVSPEPRAPAPRRRPSFAPLGEPPRLSLPGALTGKISLSPTERFEPPDWTQPLRDIEADIWEREFEDKELTLKGNVRLRLQDTFFYADEFWHSEASGEMRARGNVLVVQDPSALTADDVYYRVPDEAALPVPHLLIPAMDEQARAKRRLQSGLIEATNIAMFQPNQELKAGRLRYDVLSETGEFEDVRGRADIYYFGAKKLHVLGPGSVDAEDLWVTTCDHDPPHYKIRLKRAMIREGEVVFGKGAHFDLWEHETPVYWPRWGSAKGEAGRAVGLDFDSGHRAGIGYYVNVGQQFALSPETKLGLRFLPTSREGVGFGFESEYDFTKNPASPLFLGKGSFRTLYTTKDRGYYDFEHRHEIWDDTILLLQAEQWYDKDFLKDFYYEEYRHRTQPRTFANVTYTQPSFIATATLRQSTHDFLRETERLPEVTYHLLERRLADNLYFSFDAIDGHVEREPRSTHALRLINVGRFSYDLDVNEALGITPFLEVEGSFYSNERASDAADFRFANTIGTTLQTRFHKAYPGAFGFSGFKHVAVPSITYSYRLEPTMGVEETPRFDAYDLAHGRSRIETKLDNVVFGRDADTEEVWQVARLSLFQGNDFWNEIRKAEDYEVELDLRPRPWWGWELAGEHHSIDDEFDLEDPFWLEGWLFELYERVVGKPYNDEAAYQYRTQYGSYDRVMTYLYYDDYALDGRFSARTGFAYTETLDRTYNRELLYGAGYQLGEKWGVAFEHRYDFERDELRHQKYELRRNLHCWEAALTFRDRPSGWDVGFQFNIVAFPGTKVEF